jgi:hypothetical protein
MDLNHNTNSEINKHAGKKRNRPDLAGLRQIWARSGQGGSPASRGGERSGTPPRPQDQMEIDGRGASPSSSDACTREARPELGFGGAAAYRARRGYLRAGIGRGRVLDGSCGLSACMQKLGCAPTPTVPERLRRWRRRPGTTWKQTSTW